jgi:hypothetical protein
MKTKKQLIAIRILEEKLNYIDDKLSSMLLGEERNEQLNLLLETKDEILSELLFHEIQEQFSKIENQFNKEDDIHAREIDY